MNTRWGLVNAVTEASKEAHSYDRATELEVVGGKLLSLPQADWKTIAEAQSEVGYGIGEKADRLISGRSAFVPITTNLNYL